MVLFLQLLNIYTYDKTDFFFVIRFVIEIIELLAKAQIFV